MVSNRSNACMPYGLIFKSATAAIDMQHLVANASSPEIAFVQETKDFLLIYDNKIQNKIVSMENEDKLMVMYS